MRVRSQGFTLLEVLLALTLLGLLLALLASALLGANRAALKGERYSQRLDELRAAQNFLETAISGSLPLDIGPGAVDADSDAQRRVVFDGAAQRMSFVAGLNSALGGGIRLHTFEQMRVEGVKALQVSFARLGAAGSEPWGQPQILFRDLSTLRFAYRGRDPRGQRTEWLDNWPWPTRLPQAVRIEMTSAGPVQWPAQIVALRLELSDLQAAP